MRVGTRKPLHGGLVEMVVVAVREKHHVYRRQRIQRQRRCHDASRTHPLHGKCALAEHRIGQDVQPADLQKDGRVADPCRGAFAAARPRVCDDRGCRRERAARRRRSSCLPSALTRPSQHVEPIVGRAVGPGISESAVGLMMRRPGQRHRRARWSRVRHNPADRGAGSRNTSFTEHDPGLRGTGKRLRRGPCAEVFSHVLLVPHPRQHSRHAR